MYALFQKSQLYTQEITETPPNCQLTEDRQ